MAFRKAAAVMRSAQRRTGLSNWGDTEFLPRMEAWLTAADADRHLTEIGARNIESFALRYAINRLKLETLMADHPEIEDVEVLAPIVVTGLPRSGTTALATLIADSPRLRYLPAWEAIDPFTDEPVALRRQRAWRLRDDSMAFMPALQKMHDCRPDDFTDDQELQGLAFGSYMLEWQGHMPLWRDYYLAEDQEPVYRYLRRAMQALTFLRGPGRWVVKCPQHMEQLPALSAAFPNAVLVVTIRDRDAADRSMQRMIEYIGEHTRTRPVPRLYWRDRFDRMEAAYAATASLFPRRMELLLKEWPRAQRGTQAAVWTIAGLNLQPKEAAP